MSRTVLPSSSCFEYPRKRQKTALILALLARIFHRRGYEVVTYADPTACPLYMADSDQGQTDTTKFDVIVSDYGPLDGVPQ